MSATLETKTDYTVMSTRRINRRIDNLITVLTNRHLKMGAMERKELEEEAAYLANLVLRRG